MKKIPSVFKRDYEGTRQVYDEVVPGSEWVLSGEGTPTEKIDGTACMVRDGKLYKRYDAKKGKTPPKGWEPCEDAPDIPTGHWPGWLAVGDGPEDQWHREALQNVLLNAPAELRDGTYELVGPKVQGNPYGLEIHDLWRHGLGVLDGDYRLLPIPPRDFKGICDYLETYVIEGIVWHHPDGRMAKIKRRDFGIAWPPE